ncbi:hypothetical protein F4778DRAFT_203932 [Xylariomycetidae sp. FL2044]|nr:hypothetical protein F4778DRAFT_203932 [Xylariomycetidae sp. FL2044]
MGGLIPLLLPSSGGSRASLPAAHESSRRASMIATSSPPSGVRPHRRQHSLPTVKAAKRMSLLVPPALASIPYTSAEWRRAVDEVKTKYLNRKYRSCSARCCEILDHLKDLASVEPLYLIYLHFYAASSLEMCARPLSSSSTYRTKLLHDSHVHYDRAAALIQKTEEAITNRTRSFSSSSSSSTSSLHMHSPSLSVCSRSSSGSSTAMSSPRSSLCSFTDEVSSSSSFSSPKQAATKPKPKKKVSFSGLPDLIEFTPEPYIRPDSPTLGWEDEFVRSPDTTTMALSTVPELAAFPAPRTESLKSSLVASSRQQEEVKDDEEQQPTEREGEKKDEEEDENSPADDTFNLDAFLQTRTLNRMCAQLSALRSQVSWHREAVEGLLDDPSSAPPPVPAPTDTSTSSIPPSQPTTTRAKGEAEEDKESNEAQSAASQLPLPMPMPVPKLQRANTLPSHHSAPNKAPSPASRRPARLRQSVSYSSPRFEGTRSASSATPPIIANTPRGCDEALEQRIERLRANGWQRKRFDSRRYEALREQVLSELGGCVV